jgi:hypothetical protein
VYVYDRYLGRTPLISITAAESSLHLAEAVDIVAAAAADGVVSEKPKTALRVP